MFDPTFCQNALMPSASVSRERDDLPARGRHDASAFRVEAQQSLLDIGLGEVVGGLDLAGQRVHDRSSLGVWKPRSTRRRRRVRRGETQWRGALDVGRIGSVDCRTLIPNIDPFVA